jgi:hypothetical protein
MQSRQSPISSRKRSTTTVRSDGTAPVAAACSVRNVRRLFAESLQRDFVALSHQLSRRLADRLAELVGAADALALPERNRARHTRSGRDEDPVTRDLLDAPGRRAEQEGLSRARFVHHLFVELTDPAAAVDQIDAEEAAIRNRAGIRHRQPSHAAATANDACRAIPDDARPELGELVGGIPPGEHVEHVLELSPREVGERVGAAHELVQVVDRDLFISRDRDDLLREHIERIARNDRLLDCAFEHSPHDDRRFEQIGAELREDPSLRHGAKLVTGTADALQAACDRLRRLDLDDEIDRAHVDAELERRGGDETGDLPRLQELLDLHSLLACERTVVCARDFLLCQLVQAKREAFCETAVVDEDDRRAVLLDELEDLWVDRGPDRALRSFRADVLGRAGLTHVVDRHDHLEIELLGNARVDELDVAGAGNEAADLLHGTLRRREPDALERLVS